MSRRHDDGDDAGVAQRSLLNGGMPTILRLASGPGFAVVLVLWLLGAFPWMPSPIGRLETTVAAVDALLTKHEATTLRLLRVEVLICRGMWQGNNEMQRQCGNHSVGPEF